MMDAKFGLTALLALAMVGGIAVQRFELSPNGIGYPEITRRTSGISVYLQGSNLSETYVLIT